MPVSLISYVEVCSVKEWPFASTHLIRSFEFSFARIALLPCFDMRSPPEKGLMLNTFYRRKSTG